jgi:hypothetical protein
MSKGTKGGGKTTLSNIENFMILINSTLLNIENIWGLWPR